MYEQEMVHLKKFEKLIPEYRVRPSALLPVWDVAGFALGRHYHYLFINMTALEQKQM